MAGKARRDRAHAETTVVLDGCGKERRKNRRPASSLAKNGCEMGVLGKTGPGCRAKVK